MWGRPPPRTALDTSDDKPHLLDEETEVWEVRAPGGSQVKEGDSGHTEPAAEASWTLQDGQKDGFRALVLSFVDRSQSYPSFQVCEG